MTSAGSIDTNPARIDPAQKIDVWQCRLDWKTHLRFKQLSRSLQFATVFLHRGAEEQIPVLCC